MVLIIYNFDKIELLRLKFSMQDYFNWFCLDFSKNSSEKMCCSLILKEILIDD